MSDNPLASWFTRYLNTTEEYILDTHGCQQFWSGCSVVTKKPMTRSGSCILGSKTLTPPEQNDYVTRQYFLGETVNKFQPYIDDQQFLIRTDHALLL